MEWASHSFDEGTSPIPDYSGNGRDLNLGGGSFTPAGHTNGGLASGASGTSGAAIGGQSIGTAPVTLMAWVFPTSLGGTQTAAVLAAAGSTMVGLFVRRGDFGPAGVVQANVRRGGSLVALSLGDSAPVDTWTHLAVTFDGTTIRGYVNGVEVNSAASAGAADTATTYTVAGWLETSDASNLVVDDDRVFDEVLDEATIAALMDTPVGIVDHEVTAEINLTLDVEATAASTHRVTAAIPLELATAAATAAQHHATAAIALELAATAAAAAQHRATAAIPLTLTHAAAAAAAHRVTAAVALDLAIAAVSGLQKPDTPAERTYMIGADDRTYQVPAESRVVT